MNITLFQITELSALPNQSSDVSHSLKIGLKVKKLIDDCIVEQQEENRKQPFYYKSPLPFFQIYQPDEAPPPPLSSHITQPVAQQNLGIPPPELPPITLTEALEHYSRTLKEDIPELIEIVEKLTAYLKGDVVCRSDSIVKRVLISTTITEFVRALEKVYDDHVVMDTINDVVMRCGIAEPQMMGEIVE